MLLISAKAAALTSFIAIVPVIETALSIIVMEAALLAVFPAVSGTVLTIFSILTVCSAIIRTVIPVLLSHAPCIASVVSLEIFPAFVIASLLLSRSCLLPGSLLSLRHMAGILGTEYLDKFLLGTFPFSLFSCTLSRNVSFL